MKTIPDWFVISEMIKKIFTALYANENIPCFNEDSDIVLNCNKMGIVRIDINNISLVNNFDEKDTDTIVLVRLLTWQIRF